MYLKLTLPSGKKNSYFKKKLDYIIQDALPVPKEIEEALHSYLKEHRAIHDCERMNFIENVRCFIYKLCNMWYLSTATFAGKKDVMDGEAEEIGEMISAFGFSINYCPFCGENF